MVSTNLLFVVVLTHVFAGKNVNSHLRRWRLIDTGHTILNYVFVNYAANALRDRIYRRLACFLRITHMR